MFKVYKLTWRSLGRYYYGFKGGHCGRPDRRAPQKRQPSSSPSI